MRKYIRMVSKYKGYTALNLPLELIRVKRWGDMRYVIIEDTDEDTITIRRIIDEKSLKD